MSMKNNLNGLLTLLVLTAIGFQGCTDTTTEEETMTTIDVGAYGAVQGWLKPFQEEGFAWGGNSGVYAESPDRIFIIQRGETRLPTPIPEGFEGWAGSVGINALRQPDLRTWQNVIFTVNREGEVTDVWDQWDHLFADLNGPGPHRVRISPYDPDRHVWVVDETGHRIFVFSNDGEKLVRTYGERDVSANDQTHLGQPQDVAFLPDGRTLLADGLENKRVIILDENGDYQSEFGKSGTEELGEFAEVHALALGPDGLLFVADRQRGVHVFQQSYDLNRDYHPEFEPIALWEDFALALDLHATEEALWVSEVNPAAGLPRIIKLDFEGNHLYEWDLPTEGPSRFIESHSFAVDSESNLYLSDNQNARTHKFMPRDDADPNLQVKPAIVPE